MSPAIHLIPGLPALLVVARYRDGQVVILANADEPWRLIFNVSRALLPHHERRELLRALVG
jgi:hypothetical protein